MEVTLKDYIDVRFTALDDRLIRMEGAIGVRSNKSEAITGSLLERVEGLEKAHLVRKTEMRVWGAVLTGVYVVIVGLLRLLVP